MKKRKRISTYIIRYLFSTLLTVLLLVQPNALANQTESATLTEDSIIATGAIVIDFESGVELWSYNPDARLNAASMNKMMTVYLVYEAIEQGLIALDTIVPISQAAIDLSRNPNETNVPLTTRGNFYTVERLLNAVIVVSAGGATLALAEMIGGSRAGFLEMMNDKATEWGIDAYFLSPSGGPRDSWLTPRAMATLTRKSIQRFPEILERTALTELNFDGWVYPSTNTLLGEFQGIDGFKTGTNNTAGACFAGTAERDGVRIITVIQGSTWSRRFPDTTLMLNYGFYAAEERAEELAEVIANLGQEDDYDDPDSILIDPVEYDDPDTDELQNSEQDPDEIIDDGASEENLPETSDEPPTYEPESSEITENPSIISEHPQPRWVLILSITGGFSVLCVLFYIFYSRRYLKKPK
ncbi:MAG: D-alanyl-D-alanine carboxypeptidase [Oscillospiraceae bacterium]|nr:D-alanyl-D-alanine carboxypeptidase [Oscillospiraceae bacterium]